MGIKPGYEQVFVELAAQGQSFFIASGDSGVNVGDVGYPDNRLRPSTLHLTRHSVRHRPRGTDLQLRWRTSYPVSASSLLVGWTGEEPGA